MTATVASYEADDRQAALDWIVWATDFTESRDPLRRKLAIPPDPKADPSALQPYLSDGWSA
jgi:hypothetical protein